VETSQPEDTEQEAGVVISEERPAMEQNASSPNVWRILDRIFDSFS
jgi:hypothetical protein